MVFDQFFDYNSASNYFICLFQTSVMRAAPSAYLGPVSEIELLKQKMLLNNFQLSRNEQDNSHKWYMWHGVLAGMPYSVKHYLLCLSKSMKLGPDHRGPTKTH